MTYVFVLRSLINHHCYGFCHSGDANALLLATFLLIASAVEKRLLFYAIKKLASFCMLVSHGCDALIKVCSPNNGQIGLVYF